jgi:FtsP/CotA-like multicopper oxidase with cupredoxin domain
MAMQFMKSPRTESHWAGQILAELVIEGAEITASELVGLIPKDHPDITQAEIDASNAPQQVDLNGGNAICNATNGLCTPCDPKKDGPTCQFAFQVGERQFSSDPSAVRTLKLYTAGKPSAAEWMITTSAGFHPCHIHVNPFQVYRSEPDATGAIVQRPAWKDTLLIQQYQFPAVQMRYLRFTGEFVLHCHILTHEDQGMMQLVKIID